jgi:hypothetical protein
LSLRIALTYIDTPVPGTLTFAAYDK